MEKPKIIIIDSVKGNDALFIMSLREKHGQDVILVTPEEAKQKGITMEDIYHEPIKITMPYHNEYIDPNPKDGKANRRERRKKERKKK